MRVILGSGSPRRRELLERAGLVFEVVPSRAEELHEPGVELGRLCEINAEAKALEVAGRESGAWVIGADTLVGIDGEPLGKPADLEAARATLRRLAGRTHEVCTGVCVVAPDGGRDCFHGRTLVRFRDFDDEVIERYFERVDPLDKAGSYGIQEHGEMLVEAIEGPFDNVVGLPVDAVIERVGACDARGGG